MKQKITTHLWFDKEAKEAAKFYTSVFPDSKIKETAVIRNTPSGDTDVVTIELFGQEFTLISAGPLFKFNPSVSFLVSCRTKDEVDALWKELSKGGMALMGLGAYPFSERYGWIQDKYGLSWQLMFLGDREFRQKSARAIPLTTPTKIQFRRQRPPTLITLRHTHSIAPSHSFN